MNASISTPTLSEVDQDMIEVVETYIKNMNWYSEKITLEPSRVGYKMAFKMHNGSYRMFFDLMPDQRCFAVYCYSPVDIPANAITAVSEFVNRVNFNLYHDKLELDMDNGTIRYSCAICLEDVPLTPRIISCMEHSAAFGMDDHFPSLMAIVHGGKDPKRAFTDLLNEEITESIKENLTVAGLQTDAR